MKLLLTSCIFYLVSALSFTNGCNTTTAPATDSAVTTIILVRHAEKASDGTRDPDLNEAGKKRAIHLATMLKHENIAALYSTPYKRTQQTLQPLSDAKSIEITDYKPMDDAFLPMVLEKNKGETIVISGHSNTIPGLVNQLLDEQKYQQLDEKEYDKLFIVTITTNTQNCLVLSF